MYRRPSLRSSFNHHGMRKPLLFKLVPAFILAVAAGAGGVAVHYQTAAPTTERVVVVDKERQVSGSPENGIQSKYIVFTDKEVFENTDSMIRGKMNSSDVQAKLHVGCTYDVTAYGFRSNWLSMYRNISKVDHVPTETCPANKPPVPGRAA